MNRLKELRKEKGVRQPTLGIAIGVSVRTISRWENGETQIKPDKAQELADYFGVSVGYLLGYESKGESLLSRIEVKMMSDFLVQTGRSDEYRQGVKDLEELIVSRIGEKFSDFYSSVFSKELENEN